MKLRTELYPEKYPFQINHQDKLMLIGSCFSEHIADRLEYFRYDISRGAHGIIFHPEAIANALNHIISKESYTEKDLIEYQGRWNSLYHHGAFSQSEAALVLEKINHALKDAKHFLKSASTLIVTFGTAMGYEHKQRNHIVANCHKLPQQDFDRKLSSVEDLTTMWRALLVALKAFNPTLKVIFTISPVRHLKEGFIENQRSKARLQLLCENICSHQNETFYFPSYELIMDDLRDYRFYNPDMIHPSEQAISYIQDKFFNTIFSEKSIDACQKMLPVLQRFHHRSLHETSEMTAKRKAESEDQIRLILSY
jgi:hypothetical protein